MKKKKYRTFLESKIQSCDELGEMEKEKWAFQQCLKELNKLEEIKPKPIQSAKEYIEYKNLDLDNKLWLKFHEWERKELYKVIEQYAAQVQPTENEPKQAQKLRGLSMVYYGLLNPLKQ